MIKIKCSKPWIIGILAGIAAMPEIDGQTDTIKNRPNLLIPKFTRSIVVMKSGERRTAESSFIISGLILI